MEHTGLIMVGKMVGKAAAEQSLSIMASLRIAIKTISNPPFKEGVITISFDSNGGRCQDLRSTFVSAILHLLVQPSPSAPPLLREMWA